MYFRSYIFEVINGFKFFIEILIKTGRQHEAETLISLVDRW